MKEVMRKGLINKPILRALELLEPLYANRNDTPTFLTLELDLTRLPENTFGHIALTFGESSFDLSFNEWEPSTPQDVPSFKAGETLKICNRCRTSPIDPTNSYCPECGKTFPTREERVHVIDCVLEHSHNGRCMKGFKAEMAT